MKDFEKVTHEFCSNLFELGVTLAQEARTQQRQAAEILQSLRENRLTEHCPFCANGSLEVIASRALGRGNYRVTEKCDICGEWITREKENPNI